MNKKELIEKILDTVGEHYDDTSILAPAEEDIINLLEELYQLGVQEPKYTYPVRPAGNLNDIITNFKLYGTKNEDNS